MIDVRLMSTRGQWPVQLTAFLFGMSVLVRNAPDVPVILDAKRGDIGSTAEQYAREAFGLDYTQDETYYVMETTPGASVFLGLRGDVDHAAYFLRN